MNGAGTYVVQSGDTLSKIASDHTTTVDQLIRLNDISNPDFIRPGETIKTKADFSRVQTSVSTAAQASESNPVIQFVLVDKLLESIKNLPYQIVFSSSGKVVSGATSQYGLTSEGMGRVGEPVDFLVKQVGGGFKKIYSTTLADQRKVITAHSPSIKFEIDTRKHHGSPGDFKDAGRDINGHPTIVVDKKDVELDFLGEYNGSEITDTDYVLAAKKLGCEAAAIKAVAVTETGSVGSYYEFTGSDPVPAILFERHYFHQLTDGVHDETHPDISNKYGGGYGKYSAQYRKLLRAYRLDKSAALKSASWGKFQIMGRWHEAAGHATVESFVKHISISEKNHLDAFVNFIMADPRLSSAITKNDWLKFAKAYNGPKQKGYDVKMRENYEAFSK